jgi:hypothetical protein
MSLVSTGRRLRELAEPGCTLCLRLRSAAMMLFNVVGLCQGHSAPGAGPHVFRSAAAAVACRRRDA